MKVKRLLDKYFIKGITNIIWEYLPDFIIEDVNGNFISCLMNEYDNISKQNIKGILIIKTFIINKKEIFLYTTNLTYIKGKVEIKTDDLSCCFYSSSFNQPINWDVLNVINMEGMFCESDFNQPLNLYTLNVEDIRGTFETSIYNHPLNWDTKKVKDMGSIFMWSIYNHFLNWDIPNIKNIDWMFRMSKYNHSLNIWVEKYNICINNLY